MASYEDLKGPFTLKMKTVKLKKTFGRAKLFEIRRIVRRIKQLSLKKGTAQQLAKNNRKIDRLEKQLEFLKDTNFQTFKTSLDTEDELKDSNMATEGDSDVKSLVMSKLLEIVRKSEKSHQLEIKQKNTRKSPDPYKENDAQVAILQDDSQLIENKEIELENEFFDTNSQDLGIENSNSDSESSDSDSMSVSSFGNGKGKRGEKKEKIERKKKDVDFEDNELSSGCEEIGNKPTLSLDSVFVDSLSSGRDRLDGKRKTNGKRKRGVKSNKRNEIKKKGNRLGQRQRREQWIKMYGKKANHLKSERRKDDMNKKRRKMNSRNGNDNATKKMTKNSTTLHPSWEASKTKRKQESIVAFQGKKITFDE